MEGNKLKLETFNKTMIRILLLLAAVIFVLIGVYFYQSYKYKKITSRENLTLNEFIAFKATEELGKTNGKKERFAYMDEVDGYKRVFLNMDGHYDNAYQIEKSVSQTMKVLEILVKDKEFYDTEFKGISFQWMISVVDKYGNVSEEVGFIITLDKPELYKIKWENITREGFIKVAKTYWVHDLLL